MLSALAVNLWSSAWLWIAEAAVWLSGSQSLPTAEPMSDFDDEATRNLR